MKTVGFPFAAIVGLDTLKLALQLAAIDFRVSVLVRGDKGAGKSTAARGLSALMDAAAPFVNLPIGATEDRLLGGLDVEKALKGEPSLRRGLLAEANGGVLYIDEVNLLPDHLADALLDAVASGVHTIEREGFSETQSANFAMIGSMNP
jgi:magnesium chelatase subunit D